MTSQRVVLLTFSSVVDVSPVSPDVMFPSRAMRWRSALARYSRANFTSRCPYDPARHDEQSYFSCLV